MNPLAYHALSTFMLAEAVRQLGAAGLAQRTPRAAARRSTRCPCWSRPTATRPTSAAARPRPGCRRSPPARSRSARATRPSGIRAAPRATSPARRRAVRRLARCHASAHGLQLVPGAAARTTADGIDGYAHTVAYNGLALFGLTVALDALGATRRSAASAGCRPSAGSRSTTRTRAGSASSANRTHLARRAPQGDRPTTCATTSARSRSSAARAAAGSTCWRRARTRCSTANTAGPALIRRGRADRARRLRDPRRAAARSTVRGGYRARRPLDPPRALPLAARRAPARGSPCRGARRATASACSRSRRPAPARPARARSSPPARAGASTGRSASRRVPGYHSGPVEQLDALEARLTAPKSGRFVGRDRKLSRLLGRPVPASTLDSRRPADD